MKEHSLKDKLRLLYALQKIDAELDELHGLRGDLPDTVISLKTKQNDLQNRIADLDNFLKHGAAERTRKEKDSLTLLEKIDRYKAQQLQVRTNKEYDALTKEIDLANSTIQTYEDKIEQFAEEAQGKREQKEELEAQLAILEEELSERQKELDDILASTEKEERAFNLRRDKILKMVSNDDQTAYVRIREAKKGKAVVPVRRGSCSGCYNIVPPQMILQIKKNDRLYLCEHCGRILVSEELSKDTSPLL